MINKIKKEFGSAYRIVGESVFKHESNIRHDLSKICVIVYMIRF